MLNKYNYITQLFQFKPEGLFFNVFETKDQINTKIYFSETSFLEKIELLHLYLVEYASLFLIFLILYLLILNLIEHTLRFFLINYILSFNNKISRIYNKTFFPENFLFFFFKKTPTFIITNLANRLLMCFLLSCLIIILFNYNLYFYSNSNEFKLSLPLNYSNYNYNLIKWIPYFFDFICIGFYIDNLSLLMLFIVLSISTLVHYYSLDYMSEDPRLFTFIKYLSGFTLAMLILILSNNYALLFLGWEGVGIFSYLLIGFWYTRTLALKASIKAVVVNKIGDIALLIALGLLLWFFGTTDFQKLHYLVMYLVEQKNETIFLNIGNCKISIFTLISFFLFIAAVGKSAQFGLHTWLPDAMEGPTPVSALIHAATMVTAGVYLIVRSSYIFELSEFTWNFVIIIGGFTALFGSVVACFQYDIKKIIAFSTCSQIGYMFLACGISAYSAAMFHLFTHAFFKALLFLCAGSIIHSIADQQDIWWMGGLIKIMPITYSGILIGLLSLTGFSFTSGFYSKDSIIELTFSLNSYVGFYGFTCAVVAAFFTAFYSYRFLFYVFYSETKISRNILINCKESGDYMLYVIIILSFITIFIGFLNFTNLNTPLSLLFFYNDSIYISKNNFIHMENIFFLKKYIISYIDGWHWVDYSLTPKLSFEQRVIAAHWELFGEDHLEEYDESLTKLLLSIYTMDTFKVFGILGGPLGYDIYTFSDSFMYFLPYFLFKVVLFCIPLSGFYYSWKTIYNHNDWIYNISSKYSFFHLIRWEMLHNKLDITYFVYKNKYISWLQKNILFKINKIFSLHKIKIEDKYNKKVVKQDIKSFFFFKIWCSLQSKGLIDHLYNTVIVKPVLNFSYNICYIELDWGWLEFFFVKVITFVCFYISNSLNKSFKSLTLVFLPTMFYNLIVIICFLCLLSL